ncbi:NACHT, LRR and PYD domains-containing protein 12-like [Alosa pseudoharengus]|uniref:NACHT, LRR and PYD domains-containing protein 12-like n=1 Tax=Alosa pseudoharengus TaxID=34774 RepID=UPI003F894198
MKNDTDVTEASHGGSETHRPPSPVPSCVSMKSDGSMIRPQNFSNEPPHSKPESETHRPPSPVPSCVSMKSDGSMIRPPNFSNEPPHSKPESETHRPPSPVPSCVSMKSDGSMIRPPNFSSEPPHSKPDVLRADQSIGGEGEQELSDSNTCENINTKQTDDEVLRRVKETHKASLKRRFDNISEGIIKPGAEIPLNKIYTELYITEGESEGVNKEHEIWQVESASRAHNTEETPINCNDIFKPLPGQEKHIRTVMTKGVAGIGKTVSVQKFILDWTDGIANQDIDFLFPLPFRELNLVKSDHDQYSFHGLLLDFHPELKELKDGEEYNDCKFVFILDGLDESRLPLNFQQTMMLSDLKQTSSMDILMTSLIQGTMFPSALIWITSRPAAANQIPAQYIDQVTELRGFNDPQKEEYFRKRISDESKANRVISHIKATRSLHILCHIPVFCWIAATVLQQILEQNTTHKFPKTLTEMYIHFLLIQTTRKYQKYQSGNEMDKDKLLKSQKEMLLKLAKLAFKNLENGNLMFYEEDLQDFGIDVSEASVYSGMCTEIFKEESVFHQRKVFCFVHLSIQEFMAAVFVFHTFVTENFEAVKSLSEEHRDDPSPSILSSLRSVLGILSQDHLYRLLKSAVDEALKSRNGHLDLFVRFLMGLCLEQNQRLLKGLLDNTYRTSETIQKTCEDIKQLNSLGLSPERCINLFHCLFEMNDHSMHQEIKKHLESPKDFKDQLSPAHCSALAHMLLMSEELLDEFDLTKYNTSAEGSRRLMPAVRCCRKARLAGCKLTYKSCELAASSLQSPNSLIKLDLSDNDLGDSGVQLLSKGLSSPHCKLQTLRLAGCKLTDKSSELLASSLQSPNSLIELDLSYNDLGVSGVQLLSKGLSSPNCKLQTLRLAGCKLRNKSCEIVTRILQLHNCLIELDLSDNELRDAGVQLLGEGLSCSHCKLQTLRLAGVKLTDKSCELVATVLQSPNSLIQLDLSDNDLGDSGVELLSKGLSSLHCKLQTLRLAGCKVSVKSCEVVASVLQSQNFLIELDLNHNDLGDFGVQFLSKGLFSPHYKLQMLRLAGCKLTDKSSELLASSLQSPNTLIELDLSYNDLGVSGVQLLSKGLSSPHCRLQTLRLAGCKLSDKSCEIVASILQSHNCLIELDLSDNDLRDSGVQLLCDGLSCSHCKLQTLRLCKCGFSDEGYVCLALTLMLNPSCVKDLDVSNNHPGESAQKLLFATLEVPHCRVEVLQLAGCKLIDKSSELLASSLQSPNSLIELDLSYIDLGDSGVQLLSKGLSSPHCRLQALRLADCNLRDKSCEIVASILQSHNCLIELDLSDNELRDSGVQLLCEGLSCSHCKLQTLRLSGCRISVESCFFLASALTSNSSHLVELDLSYNHPGESVLKLLSARLKDPHCKLETLKTDHCAEIRLRPRPWKYACELTLDPNTPDRNHFLFEGTRRVTHVSDMDLLSMDLLYPQHHQVLCREGLTGRCYWEAEWSGDEVAVAYTSMEVAVAYKSMERKRYDNDIMGRNAKSWSLECSPYVYSAWHDKENIAIPTSSSRRVGVYLDWPAGTLSFYSVSSYTLHHLHTFHSTFTEPLYPSFVVGYGTSLSLCQIT